MDLRLAWALLTAALCLHAASANTVCTGTYKWVSALTTGGDNVALAPCDEIVGQLTISAPPILPPSATYINGTKLKVIKITGDLIIDAAPTLAGLTVTTITGLLTIQNNFLPGLVFDLTMITEVADMDIKSNTGLTVKFGTFKNAVPSVTMTQIQNGDYDFRGLEKMTSVNVNTCQGPNINFGDLLDVSGTVDITENIATVIKMPKMEHCGGDFNFWGNTQFDGFDLGSHEKYFGGKLALHNNLMPPNAMGNFWSDNQFLQLDNIRVHKYISVQYQVGLTQNVNFDVTMDRVATKYLFFEQNTQLRSFALSNSLFEAASGDNAAITFEYNSNINGALSVSLDEVEIFSRNTGGAVNVLSSKIRVHQNNNVQAISVSDINVWNPRGDLSVDMQIAKQEMYITHNQFKDMMTSTLDVTNMNFRNGKITLSHNNNLNVSLNRVEIASLAIKYNGNVKALTIDYLMGNKYKANTVAGVVNSPAEFREGFGVDVSYNDGQLVPPASFNIEWTNSYLRGAKYFNMRNNRAINDVTFTDVALLNHKQGAVSRFSGNHVNGMLTMNRVEVPETFRLELNNPLAGLTLSHSRVENMEIVHNRYMQSMNINDVFVNNLSIKYSNSKTGLYVTLQDLWANANSNMEYGVAKKSGKYLFFDHNDNLKFVRFDNIDAFSSSAKPAGSVLSPASNSGQITVRSNTDFHDVNTNTGVWSLEIDNSHLYSSLKISHNLALTKITISNTILEGYNGVPAGIKYNNKLAYLTIQKSTIGGTVSHANAIGNPVLVPTMPQMEVAYHTGGGTGVQMFVTFDDVMFSGLKVGQPSLKLHHNALDTLTLRGLNADHVELSYNTQPTSVLNIEDSMINFVDVKYNKMNSFNVQDSYINDVSLTHNFNAANIGSIGSIHNSFTVKYTLQPNPNLQIVFDDLWVGHDINTATELSRVKDQKYLLNAKYNLSIAHNEKLASIAIRNSHVYKSTFIKYNKSDLGFAVTLLESQHANQIVLQGNDISQVVFSHSLLHSAVELRDNTHLTNVQVKYVTMLNTKYDAGDTGFVIRNNVGPSPWPVLITNSFLKIAQNHADNLSASTTSKYAGRLSVSGNQKIQSLTIDNSMILGLPMGFQYNTLADAAVSITNTRLEQASKYGCGGGISEMCFHTFEGNHVKYMTIHNVDSAAPFKVKYNRRTLTNTHWDFTMDQAFVEFKAVNKYAKSASKFSTGTTSAQAIDWTGPSSLYMKYNNRMTNVKITHSVFTGDLLVRGTNQEVFATGLPNSQGANFEVKYLTANTVGLQFNLFSSTSFANTNVSGKRDVSNYFKGSIISVTHNKAASIGLTQIHGNAKILYNTVDTSISINGLVGTFTPFLTNKAYLWASYNYHSPTGGNIAIDIKNVKHIGQLKASYNMGKLLTNTAAQSTMTLNVENVEATHVYMNYNGRTSGGNRVFTHLSLNIKNSDFTTGDSYIRYNGEGGMSASTKIMVTHVRSQKYFLVENNHAEKVTIDFSHFIGSLTLTTSHALGKYTSSSWASVTNSNLQFLTMTQTKYLQTTHLQQVDTKYLKIQSNKYLASVKMGTGTRFHSLNLGSSASSQLTYSTNVKTLIDMTAAPTTMIARLAYAAEKIRDTSTWDTSAKYNGVGSFFTTTTMTTADFKYHFKEPTTFHPLSCLNHAATTPFTRRGQTNCISVSGCKYAKQSLPGQSSTKYRCVPTSQPVMCMANQESISAPAVPNTPISEVTALTNCQIKFGGMKIYNAQQPLPMKAEFIFGKTDIQNNVVPGTGLNEISFSNIFSFYNPGGDAVQISGNTAGKLKIGARASSGVAPQTFITGALVLKPTSGQGNTISNYFALQHLFLDTGDLTIQGQSGMQSLDIKYVRINRPTSSGAKIWIDSNTDVNKILVHEIEAPQFEISANNFLGAEKKIQVSNVRPRMAGSGSLAKFLKIDNNLGPLNEIAISNSENLGSLQIQNNEVGTISVTHFRGEDMSLVEIKSNRQVSQITVSDTNIPGVFVDGNSGLNTQVFPVTLANNNLAAFLYLTNNQDLGDTSITSTTLADSNDKFQTHQTLKISDNVGNFGLTVQDVTVLFPQKYVEKFSDPTGVVAGANVFAKHPFTFNNFEISRNNGVKYARFKDITVTGVEWSEQFGHTGPTGMTFSNNIGNQAPAPGFPLSFEQVIWHGQKYRTQFAITHNSRLASMSFKYFDLSAGKLSLYKNKNDSANTFGVSIANSHLSASVEINTNYAPKNVEIFNTNVILLSGDDTVSSPRRQLMISHNQGGVGADLAVSLKDVKILGTRASGASGTDWFTPNTSKYAALVMNNNINLKSIALSHVVTDDVSYIGSNSNQFALELKYVTGSRYISIMSNNLASLTVSHLFAQFSLDEGRSIAGVENAVDGLYIAKNSGPLEINLHNLNLVGFNEMTNTASGCVFQASTATTNKSKLCPSSLTVISNTCKGLTIDSVEMKGTAYLTHNTGTSPNKLTFTNVDLREANGIIVKYNDFPGFSLKYFQVNKDMNGDMPVGSSTWFTDLNRGEGFQVNYNSGTTFNLEHVQGANPIVLRHNHVNGNIVLNELELGQNEIMRPLAYLRVFWNNNGRVPAPLSITNVEAKNGFVSVGDNNVMALNVDTIDTRLLYINDNIVDGTLTVQNVLVSPTKKGLLFQQAYIDKTTTGTNTKYASVSVTRNTRLTGMTVKNIDISELYKTTPNTQSNSLTKQSSSLLIKYNSQTAGFPMSIKYVRVETAIKYQGNKYNAASNVNVEFNTGLTTLDISKVDMVVPRSPGPYTNNLLKYGPKVVLKYNDAGALPLAVTASNFRGQFDFEVQANKGTGQTTCGSFSFDHIKTNRMTMKDNVCNFSSLKWGAATFQYMQVQKLVVMGNTGLAGLNLVAPVDLGGFSFDNLGTGQTQVDLRGLVFDNTMYPGFRANTCERLQEAYHFDPSVVVWSSVKTAPWLLNPDAFKGQSGTREVLADCPGIDIDISVGDYAPIPRTYKYVFSSKYSVFGAKVRNFRGESMLVTDPIDAAVHMVPTSTVSYEWALRRYAKIDSADFNAGDKLLNRASNREALKITVNSNGEYTWGKDSNHANWGTSGSTRPWLISVQMLEEMEDGRLYSYSAEQVVYVSGTPTCSTAPAFTDGTSGSAPETLVVPTTDSTFSGTCTTVIPVGLYQRNENAANSKPALRYFYWIAAGIHKSTLVDTYDPSAPVAGSFYTADLIYIGEDQGNVGSAGYSMNAGLNFAVSTLPAGTWTVGVDILDVVTGSMLREIIQENIVYSERTTSVTMYDLDTWLSRTDATNGKHYQAQANIITFGAALLNYEVNATVGSEMIKKMIAKTHLVKTNIYASVPASRAITPLSRMGVASMLSGAIVAQDYLSVIDSAWLTTNVDTPIRAMLTQSVKGRAHNLAFVSEVLTIYTRLARRGRSVAMSQHPYYTQRRLLTHMQHDDFTTADVLFLNGVVQGISTAMTYVGQIFTTHESGELFRHSVNHFDFAVSGFDLKEGFNQQFSGGVDVPRGTEDTMFNIMPVGEFEHFYRVEMWTTPVVPLPGQRLVTGMASMRIRDESGAVPSAAVSELIHDAGVYVYVPILAGAEVCAEYQCLSYDPTQTIEVWTKAGLYGTSIKVGNHLKCRLTGDALVVGACTPRGSIVGDPYVFAPQSDKWVPFHPSNDQLYSLVEGKDFHVQGGFAAATKASCQCVWVDEDPSQAPRAGNRLAAVIFEFNGGVFHITPTGLFYEQAGEWMEVPKAEWSPAQIASGDALVTSGAAGELTVNDMHVEWGAIAQKESFPWGEHDYTYQFKANIPRAGLLTVLAGVDSGINVMDVHFEPKAETSVGGLIGVALAAGETGIESFAAKALP